MPKQRRTPAGHARAVAGLESKIAQAELVGWPALVESLKKSLEQLKRAYEQDGEHKRKP